MDDYISDTASTQNLFGKPQHTMFFQFFHIVSDIAPYWTQVVLTLAMAIERYFLICRATRSGNIISKRNRKLVYCGLIAVIFGICGGILFQHGYRVVKEYNELSGNPCYHCYRRESHWIEHWGRFPAVHLPTIFISICLYYKCIVVLKGSLTISRKDLLTRTFVALLVSWTVLVTPHVLFQDYVSKGRMYSLGTLMQSHQDTFIFTDIFGYGETGQHFNEAVEKKITVARHTRIEAPLRCLKMSFAFINSILLIILMRPFHQPLINFKNYLLKKNK
ncbi:uncharacterized protein LOC142353313 [Convolutriloba macropyga]|uniref:uncharacterized protein LOC142353313 n=1 Tax=Convolutriloba macropyga TaxID=536237 RepID=UPI003F523A8E